VQEAPGIVNAPSPFPVDTTVARLQEAIRSRGMTLFAHIDHGAGAREAGLRMQPAHVLIFGRAQAGTPLMVARPLLALDLPLKALVWEDAENKVWISYDSPEFLAQRHSIPAELVKNISGVAPVVATALEASTPRA
jgi:uncharacterized protein (DUF302 family)